MTMNDISRGRGYFVGAVASIRYRENGRISTFVRCVWTLQRKRTLKNIVFDFYTFALNIIIHLIKKPNLVTFNIKNDVSVCFKIIDVNIKLS